MKRLVAGIAPHAVLDRRAIDFGQTPILFPVERDLLVIDTGRVPLHVSGIAVTGAGFEGPSGALEIAAGDTAKIALIFRPPASGAFAGSVSLQTDDASVPSVTIALSGVGTEAGALAVNPPAIDFGRVGEGQTATRSIVLTSAGNADLYLGGFGLAPGTPDSFAWVGSTGAATLAAGSQATMGVRFSPTPGSPMASGAMRIDSSDPVHPQLDVPVTGSINHAPIAVAQGPSDANVGATVQLDGTASSDPDGDLPLTFSWTLATRPDGSSAAILNPTAAQPTLKLDVAGIYSILLSAADSTGLASFAPSRLDIRATPAEALAVELVWDQLAPDLDLHFLQSGAALQSAGDCWWANPDPAWGPHHQGDKLAGYGPELVTWQVPAAGTYSLQVVYAAAHNATSGTTAQVRVYAQGVLAADLTHTFSKQGETWIAGTVEWPSGHVGAAP